MEKGMYEKGKFKFKRFEVNHSNSSMKVGIDSILLGCWTNLTNVKHILDVGTGCGIVSLICAQRCPQANIKGIDIHGESIKEATLNFYNSPWRERFITEKIDFLSFKENGYDLIISNPPFFNSGVKNIQTVRETARHQKDLSPVSLIEKGVGILNPGGRLSMILPFERREEVIHKSFENGFRIERGAIVRGRPDLPPKRLLLELKKEKTDNLGKNVRETEKLNDFSFEDIIIESSLTVPSEQFKSLCKDFYLHF